MRDHTDLLVILRIFVFILGAMEHIRGYSVVVAMTGFENIMLTAA